MLPRSGRSPAIAGPRAPGRKLPISGFSGAPPETIALSRPPKRRRKPARTERSSSGSTSRSPRPGLRECRALAADRHRPVEHPARHPALALDPERDAPVHRLVEPRHRGHDRRPRFEQVGGERLGPLGKIDLRADRDREHQTGGVLVGMRQRQKAQEHLVAEPENLEQAKSAAAIREDVAMGRSSPPWARRRCPR